MSSLYPSGRLTKEQILELRERDFNSFKDEYKSLCIKYGLHIDAYNEPQQIMPFSECDYFHNDFQGEIKSLGDYDEMIESLLEIYESRLLYEERALKAALENKQRNDYLLSLTNSPKLES